jgi:regulator of sigma E protease
MIFIQNVLWYLILIGVMIMIHELGHYWAAVFFDVRVETFSFGFGPRLFGFKRGETDFRFSAILFGGYVKMTGEQIGEGGTADPRSLSAKPRWQRMIIAFAGPAINMVLAVALLAGLFMFRYPHIPNPHSPKIGYLAPEGAAAKSGIHIGDQVVQIDEISDPTWEQVAVKEVTGARHALQVWVKRGDERLRIPVTPALEEKQGIGNAGWAQEMRIRVAGFVPGIDAAKNAGIVGGDVLVSANGLPIQSAGRLNEIISAVPGSPVDVVYARNGQEFHAQVTPVRHVIDGKERWMIGVALEPLVEITRLGPAQALYESGRQNIQSAQMILTFLEGIVERRLSPKSLEGPIRIAQLSGESAREGAVSYFGLMAAVSLNLAVFNLLPVPILDGGVMLLLFIEILMRRDLDLRVKETVVKVGFVFLMVIVVFVIYNDLSKILAPS